jgi:hypothetical protein
VRELELLDRVSRRLARVEDMLGQASHWDRLVRDMESVFEAVPGAGAGAGAGGALGGGAPARALYVKVTGNAGAALDRLQAKSELEGLERAAAARRRFVKPHLARQRSASDARYNRSKRERIRLVEEMVLDRRLVPF